MTSEPPIHPLPMSRKEARAAGFKTFTAQRACHLCGSRQRTVYTSACCGCKEVEKQRDKALVEKVRTQVLASARKTVLRELNREARDAAKAAEKEAKAKERQAAKFEAEKRRKARARAAARAARLASAPAKPQATATAEPPPWEGSPSLADDAAPWD